PRGTRRKSRRSRAFSTGRNQRTACYDRSVGLVPKGAIAAVVLAIGARATAAPDASQSSKSAADAVKTADLVQTVATSKTRGQLAEFVVASAERATKARDWAHAIPYYQALVVARGPGGPEAKQLATLWTLAGQNDDAAAAWSAFAASTTDGPARNEALAEATR